MIKREAISRVRNLVKSVKQDANLSDRFIYSMIMKYAKLFMHRQDNLNRIMKFNSVFQQLDIVELEDIDTAQASCYGVYSGCTIKRTKNKLPKLFEGYYGPLIRAVSSLDQSESVQPTFASIYQYASKQKTFRYNKNKYYWYLDGYLYFPNLDWDAVRVEGVFEDDITGYNCSTSDDCTYIQDTNISIPEFLFAEIEQGILKELGASMQIPQDIQQDLRHPLS